MESQTVLPIGREQVLQFRRVLERYSAGLRQTRSRIISSENWWKLRNGTEEQYTQDGGFRSVSGWLHNVIVSKHADLVEGYPEPVLLPREQGDREEARILSAIVPCILEQNQFDTVWSDAMWQKCKTGTACYKIVWDPGKLCGLGDISIQRVNLLNLYWEPGVTDIQKSRFFFHTELCDRDLLQEEYPWLQLKGGDFLDTKFLYDDRVDTENKVTVAEVYYHRRGRLHYCKFVGDQVLFATENQLEPQLDAEGNVLKAPMAETGLYDHGRYPYEFDPLFPIEGSPCGYGYVDVCRSPQTEIDLMKTSFVRNAQVGATPRFFSRHDGAVNEEEFLNLTKPIVHVAGNLGEDSLRQIPVRALDGVYVSLLDRTIDELRQTSGNTETSTGNISAGITAASAIAALQEASGKGSRDTLASGYRCFSRIVELCVELIRQFYDLPRKFRILGAFGAEEYISYDNSRLLPVSQGEAFGQDMGLRKPVFDIRIMAQKRNSYTRVTQNELALQLYQLGFFDPARWPQARECLEMMDFEGKDVLLRRLSENAAQLRLPVEAGAAW